MVFREIELVFERLNWFSRNRIFDKSNMFISIFCFNYLFILLQEMLSAFFGVSPVKSGVSVRDTFPDAEGKYSSLELPSEP